MFCLLHLGFLLGLAFAIFYEALEIPLARRVLIGFAVGDEITY
jgi:hypothetical protein